MSTISIWKSNSNSTLNYPKCKLNLHYQMVSYNSFFFAMTSISVSFGSLQDDIDKEGQACAAMAAALPQLQTKPGRNHYKSINIISVQYYSSSSSYERIPSHEHNTYLYQVTSIRLFGPLSPAVGQEEKLCHRGAPTKACIVVEIRWLRTLPGSLICIYTLKD